jgi:peptidyl-prolyl cis-trans isomerase SurA
MKQGLFLFLLCFASFAHAQRVVLDKIIGTVGNEVILLSEVENPYAAATKERPNLPTDYRCMLLEGLLSQNLLVHRAKVDSVLVGDEEVETQLDARFEKILGYMNNDPKQFEDYYGVTVPIKKEEMRDDMKKQLMTDKMRNKIMEGMSVTPEEVKRFFGKIPKDSLPYFNSEVEVSEIVTHPKINAEQKQIAQDRLEGIRKRIVEGKEPFEGLAEKYSQDPGSGRVGGDLGWQKRGTFVPEFEAAAYKLENDQISPVFESDFGFHIVQLLDRRGNTIHARHILIKPEITREDRTLAKTKLDSVQQELVKKKITFSAAVKKYSNKKEQSFNNDGRMTNNKTGNTFFETSELDPNVFFAVDTMKIGNVTAPVEFQDPISGESVYRVIKLISRTDPHKANLRQDYAKIQKAALDQKKDKYISDWVAERIKVTYINIDGSLRQCPNMQNWLSKQTAGK